MKLKVIGFWEYKQEDVNKIVERWMERLKVQNNPDFPKTIYGPFQLYAPIFPRDTSQGFTVLEVERNEQLAALSTFYIPVAKWTFIPVLENSIGVEILRKWQQK